METIIVTCETIKDEVLLVLAESGLNYQGIWLDPGLHRSPERLRAKIMAELDALAAPTRVLLPMGSCGGGVDNIPTGQHTLIVPRCDDCLTLLLGSMTRRLALQNEAGTYFLTEGWLKADNDLIESYERTVARMGEAKAQRAHKMALAHYKRYMFLDTGTYDLEATKDKIEPFAQMIGLDIEETPADMNWLKQMITGPWTDDKFVTTPPGQVLNLICH